MREVRAQRWLGLAGLLFVALIVVAVATTPSLSTHATSTKVVSYFNAHKTTLQVSAFITALAVFEGVFFFWYLRDYLSTPISRIENVGFAGAILFAVSGALAAGIKVCLATSAGHVAPAVMQTLNVLENNLNAIITPAGIALFLIADGIAIIRSAVTARWVGWAAVVLGVIAVAAGAPAAGLWILIASIVILVRAGSNAATPAL